MIELWNIENFINIINAIPQYIIYVYPGYLTIYIYNFFRARNIVDSKSVVLKSLAISYFYVLLCRKLSISSDLILNCMLIILSLVSAFIAFHITRSKFTSMVFDFFGISTTFNDNELEALEELDQGTWLVTYLNDDNIVYEGWLFSKEMEPNKRQCICLSGYRKYLLNDSGKPIHPYIDDYSEDNNEKVIIFYDSVKRIEKRST